MKFERFSQVIFRLFFSLLISGIILFTGCGQSEQPLPTPRPTPTLVESPEPLAGATAVAATPYVEPYSPLTAVFSASVLSGEAPLTIQFDASASTNADGDIASYQWRFGDGIIAAGKQVSHEFQTPGIYLVRLDISDSLGYEAVASQEIVVTEPLVSTQELVEYIEDSGFEQSTANFEDYYDQPQSERSEANPIEGDASLHILFTSWSNVIMPVQYPWQEGPHGYTLTASGKIRVNSMTEETAVSLCAVAYWDEDGEEVRHEQCQEVSATSGDVITLSPVLQLDPEKRLGRVYFWLAYSHVGEADITLDDAHLVLDKVLGTGGR